MVSKEQFLKYTYLCLVKKDIYSLFYIEYQNPIHVSHDWLQIVKGLAQAMHGNKKIWHSLKERKFLKLTKRVLIKHINGVFLTINSFLNIFGRIIWLKFSSFCRLEILSMATIYPIDCKQIICVSDLDI